VSLYPNLDISYQTGGYMQKVVTNEQMKKMDRRTIQDLGVPGIVLMENAGYQASEIIAGFCKENAIDSVLIFTGRGNNGGDGFVIARHLHKAGFNIIVHATATGEELDGDAAVNYNICEKFGITIIRIDSAENLPEIKKPTLLVDALLGTGIKGTVKGIYAEIIEWMNTLQLPVAAIDIPSGLNGNSALVESVAVAADFTVTMGLPKCAQLFYPARSHVGDLHVVDIGMPAFVENDEAVRLNLIDADDVHLPEPEAWQNKYTAGTVFILSGSPGMTGAAVMAAQGAAVSGAGLVYVGIPWILNSVLESKLTEQLTLPLPCDDFGILKEEAIDLIREKIDWADAFLVGPGMGRHERTLGLIGSAIEYAEETNTPTVIDADGLFLLAGQPELTSRLNESFILTPHHGEFIRVSGHKKHEMQSAPWHALEEFLESHQCTVNLKGAPSRAGSQSKGIFINSTGNAGLAKGGSGDVLAGLICGLLSRNLSPLDAAIFANWLHGHAADLAADELSITGYQPTDLIYFLKTIIGRS